MGLSDDATVTIKYTDLRNLERRIEAYGAEVGAMRQEVLRAQAASPEVAICLEALSAALEFVRFGVSALYPLSFKNVPYESLRRLAGLLPKLPGDPFAPELGHIFALQADKYEFWETARANGTAQAELAELNRQFAPSPELFAKITGAKYTPPSGPLSLDEEQAMLDDKSDAPIGPERF